MRGRVQSKEEVLGSLGTGDSSHEQEANQQHLPRSHDNSSTTERVSRFKKVEEERKYICGMPGGSALTERAE